MISTTDLAWMAGVIDLKGRLSYKHNGQRKEGSRQTVLHVDSREMPIIRKLSVMTGTKAEARRTRSLAAFSRRGCAEHCPEAHIHVQGNGAVDIETTRWSITGAAAVTVLYNLGDFLQVDRDWDLVTEGINRSLALQGQGSSAILSSLERLLNLGWTIPPNYSNFVQRKLELGYSRKAAA